MRYEVILGELDVKAPPPKLSLSPKGSMSVQDIEDKLKAAEERRQVSLLQALDIATIEIVTILKN